MRRLLFVAFSTVAVGIILLVSIVFLFPKNNKPDNPNISASPTAASGEQSGESGKIAQSVIDAALAKAQEIRAMAEKMRLPLEVALAHPGLQSSEIKGKGRYLDIVDSEGQKTMKLTYIDNKLVDLFVEDSNKKSYVIHYQEAGI